MNRPLSVFAFTLIAACSLFSQSAATRPRYEAFEVATIKPANPDAPVCGVCMQGAHRFVMSGGTLKSFMVWAYNTTPDLVTGGPAWTGSERFDLVAESPNEPRPTQQENMVMLQKLLADRFKLVVHNEPKELSIYELVVGKNGPKNLRPTALPDNDPNFSFGAAGVLTASAAPLGRFCAMLQRGVIDRPCIDKTGLAGKLDFTLEFDPRRDRPADSDKPDLFTAVQEQLGLKLNPTKGKVDAIVIDKAERPSEN